LTILAFICVVGLISYNMYDAHHQKTYTAIVDFDELGSLQPEDVVVIRGYQVGSIGSVTWLGDRARVVIKFTDPIVIREGTQFNNVNYALMGQRRLEIVPSKTGNILPEEHIHQGHFEPGIAEALRLMDDVNAQLETVREVVLLITQGDSTHPSAQQMYENAIGGIEDILENADVALSNIQPQLKNMFAQVNDATNTLIDVTHQADTAVKTVSEAAQAKLQQLDDVVKSISEGTARASKVIAEIESAPAMDKLLNSKDLLNQTNEMIEALNRFFAAIDTKGIKMYDENGNQVKLFSWSKMNIIGKTAREKAKIREEKGESLP